MKTAWLLVASFLLTASIGHSFDGALGTMGFAGELEVHSVSASDRKVVFVLSGPCELLLAKDAGHAQQVSSIVDHAVLVFYRAGARFPTDTAWHAECERLKSLIGKGIYFHTASPNYTWNSADLTLISTEHLDAAEKAQTDK